MLTVRDLVESLELRLLAGEGGLDLPIRWVHMSELADPTPWLSGGEVLLTTGMQLGAQDSQREYLARLASSRLAGLGFGTGFGFQSVPEALVEAAREHDFPLFEVPYELPFIAITERAFTQLVNEQYAVLRRRLPRRSASSGSCSPSGACRSLPARSRRWSAARCSCSIPVASRLSSTSSGGPSTPTRWRR